MYRTIIAICTLVIAFAGDAQESFRGIEHIRGDVYQVQDANNTFSAFMVTPEGIILTDPMDSVTAAWLKAQLDERFDVPVQYIIYSNGIEHNGGAEIFDEGTEISFSIEHSNNFSSEARGNTFAFFDGETSVLSYSLRQGLATDWEWGVDLFANDPLVFKKLIYEMRFDEASALYALFGKFYIGLRLPVAQLGLWCSSAASSSTVAPTFISSFMHENRDKTLTH